MSRRRTPHPVVMASRRLQEQIKRETAEQQDNALPLCLACHIRATRVDLDAMAAAAKACLQACVTSSAQLHRAAVHVSFLTLQAEHDARLQDIARESRLRMAWRHP